LLLLIYWSNEFDPTKRLRRGVIIFSDQLNRVSLFRTVVCLPAVRRIGMTGLGKYRLVRTDLLCHRIFKI
jgi:hypothetical protein